MLFTLNGDGTIFYFHSSTKWKTSIHDCLRTIPLRWIWTACSFNKSSGKNKRFTAKGRWNKDWTCRGRIMTRTCSSRQVCFSEVVTNSIPSPIVQACVRCTSACAHMYSAWRAHRSQCEVDRADSISLLCLPLFFSAPRSDDSPLSLWFAVACGWEHEAVRRRN